jgi:hypothetical protein
VGPDGRGGNVKILRDLGRFQVSWTSSFHVCQTTKTTRSLTINCSPAFFFGSPQDSKSQALWPKAPKVGSKGGQSQIDHFFGKRWSYWSLPVMLSSDYVKCIYWHPSVLLKDPLQLPWITESKFCNGKVSGPNVTEPVHNLSHARNLNLHLRCTIQACIVYLSFWKCSSSFGASADLNVNS